MAVWGLSISNLALLLFALAGTSYLLLCLRHLLAFRETFSVPDLGDFPPLSILKPLCGDEPRLYECLRSFCQQNYPEFQIVFGVRDPADPAAAVVERLKDEFPELDITLVCDTRIYGANLKTSNVMNIMPACRHDLLLVSDSDVEIGPGCLRAIVADMRDPKVGAVSCLYKGRPTQGLISVLGALNINGWIVPSVLLDRALNGIDSCLGPVLLLRRTALADIGGFPAVANHLAEDHQIGDLLVAAGWTVKLSTFTIDTMVDERSLGALVRHEVRWAHTVRSVRPADHILSVVTCILPVLLLLHVANPHWWGGVMIAAYLGLRLALDRVMNARLSLVHRAPLWMVPIRECLCFAVWFYATFSRAVVWRGQPFRLESGGRLVPLNGEYEATAVIQPHESAKP
jgi:ceramide glucosyltransferase